VHQPTQLCDSNRECLRALECVCGATVNAIDRLTLATPVSFHAGM
jgi:hypothetical protein